MDTALDLVTLTSGTFTTFVQKPKLYVQSLMDPCNAKGESDFRE
jgi:hypothetical protein